MPLDDEIPEWARSCVSGKQKFASPDAAKGYLKSTRRKKMHGPIRGTPHVYRCPMCDAYHYTTAARRRNGGKF